MFEGCLEINDYITEIFRMGLKESFTQIIDNSEIDGYYLSIPSREKSKKNTEKVEKITEKVEKIEEKAKCPECGAELSFTGGCNVCPSCGWSRCS